MKTYSKCQSCGLPLSKDHGENGSDRYCSHCFQDGEFTSPELTVEQMKAQVRQKVMEQGFPKYMANLFIEDLDKLERWQN